MNHNASNDSAFSDDLALIAALSEEIRNTRALSPHEKRLSPKSVLHRFQLRSRLINLLDLTALCVLAGPQAAEDDRRLLRGLHDEIRETRAAFENSRSQNVKDLAKRCYGLAYQVMVRGQSGKT